MNSKIEKVPPYKTAYMRKIGAYGSGNVELMEQLKSWAQNNNLLSEGAIILGIAQDNPNTTNAELCRYDVCLVISNNYRIVHDEIKQGHITGGKYIVFTVTHTAEAVQQAWASIFPELIKQDYILDDTRPIIERYQTHMIKNHVCEICVPIY
jgi:DNA gyrase inhibitor GyrI